MAGLLDLFSGDDGQQALGLLAAAGPSMQPQNLASRLAMAGKTYNALKDNQLGNQFKQAQIDDIAQQVELRRQQAAQMARRNEWVTNLLGQMDANVPGANDAVVAQTGNLAPTNANGALQTQAAGRLNAGNPLNGIPRQAVMADLAFNDGKNIGEWSFKRGVPDMQVSNGYAYDKNRVQPGFMPQLTIAQNGQASLAIPGANGLPVISAPQGAVQTATDYARAQGTTKPMKVYNPATKRDEYITETQASDAANRGATASTSAERDQRAIYDGELAQAREELRTAKTPQERSRALSDITAIQRERKRLGFAAGPATDEAADAERLKAQAQAEGTGAGNRTTEQVGKGDQANESLINIARARNLLQMDPTHSVVGAGIDKLMGMGGVATQGGQTAAALENLAGWMTTNVPRMQGPQSDKDVAMYRQMAGKVGDRTLPIADRLAALQEVERIQQRYAGLNAGIQALPAKPSPQNLIKGKSYQLPDGRTGVWDGMGFKVQ